MKGITPCLWFDTEAEDAATYYTSLFPDGKVLGTTYYGEDAPRPAGTVMTVSFTLQGQEFVALNGGPEFSFDEAVSFQVMCESQEEVDHYWRGLSAGGAEGPCGWVKDRFGLSWQVCPVVLPELLADPDPHRAKRVMAAVLQMRKLDIAALQTAADGT
jgi:predicted 3-demethylubiquinone-9 3-methyltransferase (glyoxalase superfamily)